jgi:hypothetical protein
MAMAAVFLGCPTDTGTDSSSGGDKPVPINRPDGASGKIAEPILLEDGAYVANTKIEIDTRGDGMSVIYTLDGSEPDPENPATRIYDAEFPPRMKFEGGAASFTLKARAVKPGRESSDVATGTYTEASIAPNNVMQGIIAQINAAAGGGAVGTPITVTLPAGTKLWDVGIKFQDPDNPRREQCAVNGSFVLSRIGSGYDWATFRITYDNTAGGGYRRTTDGALLKSFDLVSLDYWHSPWN